MADITAISAGIGGGKSLFATIQICNELEKSERFIVTNVPLKLPEIAEYCHKYIDRPVDLNKRLRVLHREECHRFFLHLPQKDFAHVSEVATRQGHDYGCLYVLDEAHIIYPAREYMKTGPDVEAYVSQLRKLNDDFIWVTQHTEKVDKNFRRNTTRWLIVKNMGKSRLLLGVGFPGSFKWDEFSVEPRRGDKPEATGWYRMKDRGYKDCYDTMAGVGFAGGMAADTKPKRGHWWRWIAAALFLATLAWFIPKMMSKGIGYAVGQTVTVGADSMSKSLGIGGIGKSTNTIELKPAQPQAQVPVQELHSATKPKEQSGDPRDALCVVGFDMLTRNRLRCMLSDGRWGTASRVKVGEWAIIDGEVIPWYVEGYHKRPRPAQPETIPNPDNREYPR